MTERAGESLRERVRALRSHGGEAGAAACILTNADTKAMLYQSEVWALLAALADTPEPSADDLAEHHRQWRREQYENEYDTGEPSGEPEPKETTCPHCMTDLRVQWDERGEIVSVLALGEPSGDGLREALASAAVVLEVLSAERDAGAQWYRTWLAPEFRRCIDNAITQMRNIDAARWLADK